MSAIANRSRTLPWILGLGILAFSLFTASRLVGQADAQTPSTEKTVKTDINPSGLTILGTVDAVPGVVRVDPPAIAGALSVKALLVEEGKLVAVGDPLIQFDDEVYRQGLAQAEAGLVAARWQYEKATAGRNDHKDLLRKQQLAVDVAKYKVEKAREAYKLGVDTFERALNAERNLTLDTPLGEAEKTRRRKENQELLKADTLIYLAQKDLEKEEIDLERLRAAPVEADANAASAEVARLVAKVEELKAMVSACKVTAKVAGTVEQRVATPGMLFGPATRTPAMLIVPSGERIVRAEVEAEFVARVADKVGKKVTITDSHHFTNSYEGVVVRVGTSLLPKRGVGDLLTGPPTKVLECLIKINDPAPPGKPPLVVGQPVRVVFGS